MQIKDIIWLPDIIDKLDWKHQIVPEEVEQVFMNAKSKLQEPIPEEFESIEAAGDFWDTHDLSDYWEQTSEAHFEVNLSRRVILVPLEQNVAHQLANVARRQGLSTETLVNVWLNERLQQAKVPA